VARERSQKPLMKILIFTSILKNPKTVIANVKAETSDLDQKFSFGVLYDFAHENNLEGQSSRSLI
jgi:hypothetical protein